jgi:hypothetical protein
VIKTPSDDESSRAAGAPGAYLKEVRFYEQLQQRVEVQTPEMLFAAIDESTNAFVLVLEDLRPAQQGDQIDGCTVEQAQLAALNIAGLHGPTWCDESLRDLTWLVPSPEETAATRAQLQQVLLALTEAFIGRYEPLLEDGHAELLKWFATRVDQWLDLHPDRFALTHADHRLDNLLFGTAEGGHPVSAVDWQTIGLRNPLADVAYLLGTGLEPETRRAVEHEIVHDYHKELVSFGVDDYPASLCVEDYASESFHALLIIVLGSMMAGQTPRGDQMFMTMLRRSARQIDDLDARRFLQ